jgi:hypothetical protein
LFFRSAAATTQRGTNTNDQRGSAKGWWSQGFATTRGGGVTSQNAATVTGATAGIELDDASGFLYEWISDPLDADTTISGTITLNLWASESSMNANVAINARIDRLDSQGAIASTILTTARVTEVAITTRAANNFTGTPTSTAFLKGDRIRVVVFGDDAGTMATGFTFDFGYNGTSAAADGDSYVTFTETFGFLTTVPAGSTLYLTNTDLALATVNDTGFGTATVATSDDQGGTPNWTNPANAEVSDDVYATLVLAGTGGDILTLRTYGFSLPAGSIIRGIEAIIEGKVSTGTYNMSGALYVDEVGNRSSKTLTLTTTEQQFTLGGLADNWNPTIFLTETLVEGSSFSVRGVTATTATLTISIDYIAVKVYYSTNGLEKEMWTSRGGGDIQVDNRGTSSVSNWVAVPVQNYTSTSVGGVQLEWYTKPLVAFTLSGLVRANLRTNQVSAAGDTSPRAEIAVCDADGSNAVIWGAAYFNDATGGEMTSTQAAYIIDVAGDDLAVTDGQRIRLRWYYGPKSTSQKGGEAISSYYAGTSGGASGDSYLILPQTVTEAATIPRHPAINHCNPALA